MHDYNDDGKPDLILGDYSILTQLKKLNDEAKDELSALRRREKQLKKTVTDVHVDVITYREPLEDAAKEADYQKKKSELMNVMKKLDKFYQYNGSTSFVWVLLRI